MDLTVFQLILLGLLAIGVLVLLVLISVLAGIRKALESRAASAAGPEPQQAIAAAPAAAEPATVGMQASPAPAAGGYMGGAAGTYGSASQSTAGYAGESQAAPVATEPEPQPTDQSAAIRSVLEDHGVGATAAPAASGPVVESALAAHVDAEPEEEPFQRDGRWWFKRGGELMIYDEPSGQWQPTERPVEWGAASAPETAAPAAATPPAAAATEARPSASASFWKCPSCGAVNGAMAGSCRMCFTPRP